jgi:hypothetical protein
MSTLLLLASVLAWPKGEFGEQAFFCKYTHVLRAVARETLDAFAHSYYYITK